MGNGWKVVYDRRFEEWDEKSSPQVVDGAGKFVMKPHQNVAHPGAYDKKADELAHLIVAAVNSYQRRRSTVPKR